MGFNPRQVTFTLFGAAWGAVQTRIIYKKTDMIYIETSIQKHISPQIDGFLWVSFYSRLSATYHTYIKV